MVCNCRDGCMPFVTVIFHPFPPPSRPDVLVTRLCSLRLSISAYVLHLSGSTKDEPVDEAWPSVPNMAAAPDAVGVMLNACGRNAGCCARNVDCWLRCTTVLSDLGRHPTMLHGTWYLVVMRKRGKQVAARLVGRRAAPGGMKRQASA